MKKIIALLLCLVMMLALAACGGSEIEQYEDTETAETTETVDVEAAETVESAGLGYSAYPGDTVVGTVNGEEVTWMEYFYWLNSATVYFQQMAAAAGVMLSSWDANEISTEQTNAQVIIENAQFPIAQYHVLTQKAIELGLGLDEEDEAIVRQVVEQNADQATGDADGVCTEEEIAAFEEYLASQNIDLDFFEYINEVTLMNENLFLNIYGLDGQNYSDADTLAFAEENGVLAAKHILLLTQDMTTGEALTEDEIAAQKALADDLAAQLQEVSGDQTALIALFDQLTAEHTEDTGYATFPDGYHFVEGEMVTEFTEAVKALDENYGLSGVVESSYGYHIIMRIPVEPDGIHTSTGYPLRFIAADAAYGADISTWMNEAEVVWNEGFDALDMTAIFG